MSFHFKIAQKKISIDNEDINNIINILTTILAQNNNIDLNIVNGDEFHKQGIWYSLIVKKIEDITGDKHGSSLKLLPEMLVKLDFFAFNLFEEFQAYITHLLKIQTISSDKIISEIISDKFVLIREILLRLISHALSADRNGHNEGETILNVTRDFLRQLNLKELMFNKSIMGALETTTFGASLATQMDYWLKLMTNTVNITMLLHKNTHACSNCFKFLQGLKLITLRQLAVLMDSTKDICDYHDDILPITFETILVEKKILAIKALINANYIHSTNNNPFDNEQLKCIDSCLSNSEFKTSGFKVAIKERFYLLIRINFLERLLDKISIIMTALGWFPVITGTLELNGFSQYLNVLANLAINILNANTISGITDSARVVLIKYCSMTAGDINLVHGFEMANKHLEDLSNPEIIGRLLELIGYTANELIALQHELGIVVINKDKLLKLCQALTNLNTKNQLDNSTTNLSLSSTLTATTQNSVLQNFTGKPIQRFFDNQKQTPTSTRVLPSINPAISRSIENNVTKTNLPQSPICTIETNTELITQPHTYVINKIHNTWQITYYEFPSNLKAKLINSNEIMGLFTFLSSLESNSLNSTEITNIEHLVSAYHIREQLRKFIEGKYYEQGLQFIEKHKNFIGNNTWLNEFSSLCKATCYFKLARKETKALTNKPHNPETVFLRKQAEELHLKAKAATVEIKEMLNPVPEKKVEENNSSCTLS